MEPQELEIWNALNKILGKKQTNLGHFDNQGTKKVMNPALVILKQLWFNSTFVYNLNSGNVSTFKSHEPIFYSQ